MEEGGRRGKSGGGEKKKKDKWERSCLSTRRGCPGPAHLPLVEELLKLVVSCVEVLVRGSWPPFVQDIGRRQIVLQPQEEFLCLGWEQGGWEWDDEKTSWQANWHPDPTTLRKKATHREKQQVQLRRWKGVPSWSLSVWMQTWGWAVRAWSGDGGERRSSSKQIPSTQGGEVGGAIWKLALIFCFCSFLFSRLIIAYRWLPHCLC